MFRENFVEHKGTVYASLSSAMTDGYDVDFDDTDRAPERSHLSVGGLYKVTDDSGTCVNLQLIYEDDSIGQIVASSQFDPIEIIGVSGSKIYGYYPESGGTWSREQTWGDATDGTLTVEPVLSDESGLVSGLTSNGKLFNLWGSFSIDDPAKRNFNYAPQDHIHCSARPAGIGDWTGFWAGSRGVYCPQEGSKQLVKYTWHGDGPTTTPMDWAPAARIGRLSPASNIYGISPNGNLLVLWDDGTTVRSAPLDLGPELKDVVAIGGVDNGYARGFFARTISGQVFNVYWEWPDGWQSKALITPDFQGHCILWGATQDFFGNFGDQTYVLHGEFTVQRCTCGPSSNDWHYTISRLDYVGGPNRHDLVDIGSGNVPSRRLDVDGRRLCG
mmetsp:Transcript_28519/g.60443  ORF Transcript_28519/g.60443 Transcript_28519/m.60443 type:complete len:386 (+) Transcript_28519:345-1502(+)